MKISGSSNILEVEYKDGALRVVFRNNTIYEYYNVPESVYSAFISASLKGKYLDTFIKGVYTFRRIR